jgi:hypothetical protein
LSDALCGEIVADDKRNAVLTPKDSIQMDFADGSKQCDLLVRRKGIREGHGPPGGAEEVEYGYWELVGCSGACHPKAFR